MKVHNQEGESVTQTSLSQKKEGEDLFGIKDKS